MIAEFSSWQPFGLKPKAILVLTPPSQSDGRGDIYDPFWCKFAEDENLALVGCYFQDDTPSGIEQYADAEESGGRLMLFLQEIFGNPLSIPILLWGFSAGGQFNYEFTTRYAPYVLAFVVNKGGIYYTALAGAASRKVPGLFIIGERDSQWRKDIVKGIHGVNRVAGANWQLGEEPGVGHEIANSKILGRDFFKAVLG